MKSRIAFFIITISIIACTTVVDFDLPLEKRKVVVNSFFSADSVWQMQISRSNSILDANSFFTPLTDAVVTIIDQNNQWVETITSSPDPQAIYRYKGITKPEAGKVYTAQITINNEPVIVATCKTPTRVPITSVAIDSAQFKSQGEAIEMNIGFNDPATERNFYTIKIIEDAYYLVNDDTVWLKQELHFELVDLTLTGSLKEPDKFINDNLFNGKDHTIKLKLFGRSFFGPSMRVVHTQLMMLNITEEYYKYFITKNLQNDTNGDPFAQPVQVFSNIKNGLGIFAGYSSSVVELK